MKKKKDRVGKHKDVEVNLKSIKLNLNMLVTIFYYIAF